MRHGSHPLGTRAADTRLGFAWEKLSEQTTQNGSGREPPEHRTSLARVARLNGWPSDGHQASR